jgi:FKBP-type peptidyl-prolyl cis-trans isomerase
MRLRRLFVTLLPLAFAACLEGSDYGTNLPPVVPIEQTTFAASLNVDLSKSTKTSTGLYIRDLTVGTGTAATATSRVGVYYAGYLATGELFDDTVSPSTPAGFSLGTNSVIAGWDEGLVGMKVGGIRQLIVPSSLAYGPYGLPPGKKGIAIPSNANLVFTVELVSVL